MAVATHTTATAGTTRRVVAPFAAQVITPDLRAEIHRRIDALMAEAAAAIDSADYLIRFLDAADAPVIDMEPDTEGEDEPGEAWTQPVTLAPSVAPIVTIRPTAREQRAAYRRIGAPIPANLRRRGLLGSSRA